LLSHGYIKRFLTLGFAELGGTAPVNTYLYACPPMNEEPALSLKGEFLSCSTAEHSSQ